MATEPGASAGGAPQPRIERPAWLLADDDPGPAALEPEARADEAEEEPAHPRPRAAPAVGRGEIPAHVPAWRRESYHAEMRDRGRARAVPLAALIAALLLGAAAVAWVEGARPGGAFPTTFSQGR
ncbi:MAG: hypothetical protein ACREPI_06860 [Candidatus Dormibacterales bacterium]